MNNKRCSYHSGNFKGFRSSVAGTRDKVRIFQTREIHDYISNKETVLRTLYLHNFSESLELLKKNPKSYFKKRKACRKLPQTQWLN